MAKRKGFLLIEAVFSIFITFLCVLVLQGLMKNLLNLKKYQSNANEIAFSYVQLEQFFNEKNTITYALPEKSTSFKAVLCREKDGQKKVYIVEQYRHILRMTTVHSGHMPLLLNIKEASFQTRDRLLKIKIEEKDGRESCLYFKLHSQPVKKHEQKKKKVKKAITKKNNSKRIIK